MSYDAWLHAKKEELLWFPCHQPERRLDEYTTFHFGCSGCAVAYEAQQAPPPPGMFDGWHRTWDATTLDILRSGDIHRARGTIAGREALEETRRDDSAGH